MLGEDREHADRAAERQRADVAHEHLRRIRVVPEEADAAAEQRGAEDRELADAGDVGDVRYCAIVTSWPPWTSSVVGTPAMYANTRNVPAFMIEGPIARPSRPSVRFTAFAVPTTTNAPNPQYSQAGIVMPPS